MRLLTFSLVILFSDGPANHLKYACQMQWCHPGCCSFNLQLFWLLLVQSYYGFFQMLLVQSKQSRCCGFKPISLCKGIGGSVHGCPQSRCCGFNPWFSPISVFWVQSVAFIPVCVRRVITMALILIWVSWVQSKALINVLGYWGFRPLLSFQLGCCGFSLRL